MNTKRENKTINQRKRRSEFLLDNSDDDDESEENEVNQRRKINYNPNVLKTSITPRKGRDLERTRSRPNQKVEIRSSAYSDNNTDREIREEDNDEDDSAILYAHSLINANKHDCCKERLEIGKNIIMKSKYNAEIQKKEFKDKIQKIFKEIYTYYYNSGQNKSSKNLEKEIRTLSSQINDKLLNGRGDFLHQFLRLLHDNILVYVKTFKDSIKDKTVNKTLKEKFHELKKQIHSDLTKDFPETTEPFKLREEKSIKLKNDILNFCKENKNEIVSIINDLNKIYSILKNSSPLLYQIFKIPFTEIEKEYETDLTVENIHKEEFFSVIINDDFIKSLIIEVKNKEIASFICLRPIIFNIEEEITNASKDMTKLKNLLDDIEKVDKEDAKEDDLSYFNDAKSLHNFLINTSKNNPRVGNCINVNCKNNTNLFIAKNEKCTKFQVDLLENNLNPQITSTSAGVNVFSPNISKVKLNDETAPKNLDELYEYIIADDKKLTKKQGKKNSNKNGASSANNNNNNLSKKKNQNLINGNGISKDSFTLENEREFEEFRNKINVETIHASCVRKVKPKITFEWIQFIAKV